MKDVKGIMGVRKIVAELFSDYRPRMQILACYLNISFFTLLTRRRILPDNPLFKLKDKK